MSDRTYDQPLMNTQPLYLDIETMPSMRDDLRSRIEEAIRPPGTMKKPETIANWERNTKPEAVDEKLRRTSLDGTWGELAVIGYAVGDAEPTTLVRMEPFDDDETERLLLERFWELLGRTVQRENTTLGAWVGHNLAEFDVRFLWQRSVVRNTPPTVHVPVDVPAWSDDIFDTMHAWAGRRGTVSLADLAHALGFERFDDLDGSKVWDYIQEGRIDEVAEYCAEDVRMTRRIHQRLTFQPDSFERIG